MVIRTSADRAFVRVGSVQLQLQRRRNPHRQDGKRRKAYLCPVRYYNSERRVDGKRRAAPADVCLRRKWLACRHGIPQLHDGCKCNGGVPVCEEHTGRYTARAQQHGQEAGQPPVLKKSVNLFTDFFKSNLFNNLFTVLDAMNKL